MKWKYLNLPIVNQWLNGRVRTFFSFYPGDIWVQGLAMKALVNGGDWKMALKLFEAWGPYCSSKKGYRLIKFCCGLEMCNMYIYIYIMYML